MILNALKPRKALNKAFLKVKPNRSDIEAFKAGLISFLDHTKDSESEEYHKNLASDFLKRTYYGTDHFINTRGRNDLVIHNGTGPDSSVGVIIEAKKPTNKAEMITPKNLNAKAFHELMLYYLRERITHNNLEIKHLIATNIFEWYIFDATAFERLFAQNKKLVEQYRDFEAGRLADNRTDFFYRQIAEPFIAGLPEDTTIDFAYFDFREYDVPIHNDDPKDDHKLIALFKLLSPENLLKLPFANDSNSLDKTFYAELLHIIGLSETKEGGKKLIGRNNPDERISGSLLENTILQLDILDKVSRLPKPSVYGANREERLFNVGLELTITWINRILFLKLLEAQLIDYHKGDKSYAFLSIDRISDYDELNSLFFQVLARTPDERHGEIRKAFEKVPYLNSSLFEPSDLEHATLLISNLRDNIAIPLHARTVLKDAHGKKRSGELNAIEYLFSFLDAYDFTSEGAEEIQEDNKTLINASVLGLIFEKINGYKDGSFFTPGFITMYMCRETIRKAVVQKFNERKGWACQNLDELYDLIEDRNEANDIVNSLRICDPAVGSGHFLVSALNEIIAIKSDLNILQDRNGRRLKEYTVEVVNDELIITDEEGELFDYRPHHPECQRVQEALFHEKQTIIENCLFGVDINPNSVKICRLRLWIELLKNAYYKNENELETLPNIDINIKCGNSLVSRFGLQDDLRQALKSNKWNVNDYRIAVTTYRNAPTKEVKHEMERLISMIKSNFQTEIAKNDPRLKELNRLRGELELLIQPKLFPPSAQEKAAEEKKLQQLPVKIAALEAEIEEIKNNKIYENSFEWRFEFPEVLDDDGNFVGFDVVIGNPPYIRQEEIKEFKPYFKSNYEFYSGTADIYVFFVEKGFSILKEHGLFTYIMPNKFMQAGYGQPVRKFLLSQDLIEIIDFGDIQVFEEATTYPCILILRKSESRTNLFVTKIASNNFILDFSTFIRENRSVLQNKALTPNIWIISEGHENDLLENLIKKYPNLEEYVKGSAKRGVLTGLTNAFIIEENIREKIIIEDPKSETLIKPILRGRDISPWYSRAGKVWLISTFPSLEIEIDEFLGIKNHFLDFGKTALEQSGAKGSRKKTNNKWYETQDTIAYYRDFEKPKIMYQKFQVRPCFIYDDTGLYCNDSMWIIPTDDKVLLGILNSRLGWWLISKYCTAIQNGYQLIWKYLGQIPIATGTDNQRDEIEDLVNKILHSKSEDVDADISSYERELDRLIYELYGLTEEEVRVVENA